MNRPPGWPVGQWSGQRANECKGPSQKRQWGAREEQGAWRLEVREEGESPGARGLEGGGGGPCGHSGKTWTFCLLL